MSISARVHAAAAALLALAGCRFAPTVVSGSLGCDQGRCPAGLVCRMSVCCAPGDARCPAPSDASPPATDVATGLQPPADAGPAPIQVVQVLSGNARLIAAKQGCTNAGEGGGQDRWCAVYRGAELWVFNATRALTVGHLDCQGGGPDCLRLSTTAFRGDATTGNDRPSLFRGDLLIYFADARPRTPGDPYRGGVYAWRPGWTVGRRLTTADGQDCTVNKLDGTTVACLQNNDGTYVDITGGRLTADSVLPLPTIERSVQDSTNIRMTYAGDFIVYGWTPKPEQAPSVWVVAAGQVSNPGAKTMVASGAVVWAVTGNGTRAFLGTIMKPADLPTSLVRVDLPSGKNPVQLTTSIDWGMGFETADRDLGFLAFADIDDQSYGDVRLFHDASMPLASFSLGRADVSSFQASPGGRFLLFQARTNPPLTADFRLIDTGTGAGCLLGPTDPDVWNDDALSPDDQLVYWGKIPDPDTHAEEGWISATADCKPLRKVGTHVGVSYWLGQAGMAYQDDYSIATGGTIRLLGPLPELATAPPRTVADRTDQPFSVVRGTAPAVVFTSSAPGREGVYLARIPL